MATHGKARKIGYTWYTTMYYPEKSIMSYQSCGRILNTLIPRSVRNIRIPRQKKYADHTRER